jgi:predicted nuclease with RNAse H fold
MPILDYTTKVPVARTVAASGTMNTVITLGIDMSSQPKGTAACTITWEANRAVAVAPRLACDDETLDEMIAESDAVGIDAPFGWPAEFSVAVGAWSFASWTNQLRGRLCFRETDRLVHETVGRWPLSVSADRIAVPAMRTIALLHRHGVTDRSGAEKFYEVYPAASLMQWGLISRGYKKSTPEHKRARESTLTGLRETMPWLVMPDACAATGHGLDALIASLTARAATQGRTLRATSEQATYARSEGWIHLPTDLPGL